MFLGMFSRRQISFAARARAERARRYGLPLPDRVVPSAQQSPGPRDPEIKLAARHIFDRVTKGTPIPEGSRVREEQE